LNVIISILSQNSSKYTIYILLLLPNLFLNIAIQRLFYLENFIWFYFCKKKPIFNYMRGWRKRRIPLGCWLVKVFAHPEVESNVTVSKQTRLFFFILRSLFPAAIAISQRATLVDRVRIVQSGTLVGGGTGFKFVPKIILLHSTPLYFLRHLLTEWWNCVNWSFLSFECYLLPWTWNFHDAVHDIYINKQRWKVLFLNSAWVIRNETSKLRMHKL